MLISALVILSFFIQILQIALNKQIILNLLENGINTTISINNVDLNEMKKSYFKSKCREYEFLSSEQKVVSKFIEFSTLMLIESIVILALIIMILVSKYYFLALIASFFTVLSVFIYKKSEKSQEAEMNKIITKNMEYQCYTESILDFRSIMDRNFYSFLSKRLFKRLNSIQNNTELFFSVLYLY